LAGPYFLVVYIEGRPTISQCYVITFTSQNHKSGGPTGQDTAWPTGESGTSLIVVPARRYRDL